MCTNTVQSLCGIDTSDFVFFLLGCSFSFEEALVDAGISLRHLDQQKNVAMYRTSIPLSPVGDFHGSMVVSMRPIPDHRVDDAVVIVDFAVGIVSVAGIDIDGLQGPLVDGER